MTSHLAWPGRSLAATYPRVAKQLVSPRFWSGVAQVYSRYTDTVVFVAVLAAVICSGIGFLSNVVGSFILGQTIPASMCWSPR
jgi:hypothetical protein